MTYWNNTVFIKFRNRRKRETTKAFEIFCTKKPQIRSINLNNPFEYCPAGLFLLPFSSFFESWVTFTVKPYSKALNSNNNFQSLFL